MGGALVEPPWQHQLHCSTTPRRAQILRRARFWRRCGRMVQAGSFDWLSKLLRLGARSLLVARAVVALS